MMAHRGGQAQGAGDKLMTSTEMPRARAKARFWPSRSQTRVVTTAMVMTAGTKMPDTPVSDLGDGGLGGGGVADHPNDLGQGGILAHPGGLAPQKARLG